MITKIKVKPKGQNTHPVKLIEELIQAIASVERDFVYVDREHYISTNKFNIIIIYKGL